MCMRTLDSVVAKLPLGLWQKGMETQLLHYRVTSTPRGTSTDIDDLKRKGRS